MKLKKRYVLPGMLIAVLLVVGVYFYLQKYQQLVGEGFQLSDQHCIAINPLIKQRKRAYIDGIKTLQASGSAGMATYLAYQDQYRNISKEYITLETLWLQQQYDFLTRSDVQLLIDQNTRDAGNYQHSMYRAELEGVKAIIKKMDEEDGVGEQNLDDVIARTEQELRIAQQGFDLKFKNTKPSFLYSFIAIPESQCPPENSEFPDIQQELGGRVIGP